MALFKTLGNVTQVTAENNCQKRLPNKEKLCLLRAPPHLRTDGRVVDRARLESVFTVKGNEGSNPSLSAIHCIRTDFASLCVFIGYSGILVFLGVAWLTVLNGRKVGNPLEIGQKTVADF